MASTQMTYAQALTEAKQIIVQQSQRIKTDGERIKALQSQLEEQAAALVEAEARHADQIHTLEARLVEAVRGREQAESIVDRQGERLTALQHSSAELERQITEQADRIVALTSERDELTMQVPSSEDQEALAELSSLLTTKKVTVTVAPAVGKPTSATPMRIASGIADAMAA